MVLKARYQRALLATLGALVGGLVFASAPALAAPGYALSGSFAPPSGFEGPVGLDVDNSLGSSAGDVYVADQGHGVVDQFSAAGALLGDVAVPSAGLEQLTVDDFPALGGLGEAGDVYVAGRESGVVYRFSPSLALESEMQGFSEPTAAAVDEAGDMFVSEYAGNPSSAKVLEFNKEGEPVNAAGHTAAGTTDFSNVVIDGMVVKGENGEPQTVGLNEPRALAVSANGEELYVATASGTLQYTLTGGVYVQHTVVDPEGSTGVSLAPSSGDVLVDQGGEVREYAPAGGEPLSELGGGRLAGGYGVGASESGDVYVADRYAENGGLVDVFKPGETPATPVTGAPDDVMSTTATLNGTLNTGAGGTSGYYFRYSTGASCEGESQTPEHAGTSGPVQPDEVTELQPHTKYMACLVATNEYGTTSGPSVEFETKDAKPLIEEELLSEAGDRSAKVTGQVNMENLAGSYYYEYAKTSNPSSGEPKKTTPTPLPSSGNAAPAPGELTELQPNTEYTFKLVATNTAGETTTGEAQRLTTQPAGIHGLPDDRVEEMVTPSDNQDADVYVPEAVAFENLVEGIQTRYPFSVALDGEAVAYQGDPTSNGDGHEGGSGLGDQYLATHLPGGGWSQVSIQPRLREATTYQGFSSDLLSGVLASGVGAESQAPPLPGGEAAPGDGRRVLYGRRFDEEDYQPLFTTTPPNRSGSAAEVPLIGGEEGPVYAGGSENLSEMFFEGDDALIDGQGVLEQELQEDVKQEIREGENHNYLYGSEDGRLTLVDVLPNGKVAPDATFGGPALHADEEVPSGGSYFFQHNPPDFSDAVSGDGGRVYWTDHAPGLDENHIFMRENPSQPESPLSAQGQCAVAADACTVPVSAGKAQFWTATPDGRYAFYTEGEGLYRFNAESGSSSALIDAGEGVQGTVGVSDSGEDVYFVATSVLAAGATNEQPNLYLSQGGTPVRFITTLSSDDEHHLERYASVDKNYGEVGDLQAALGWRTAEVSPGGGSVVFMHGNGVYVYEADVNKVFCVSCDSNGNTGAFLPVSWSFTYMPVWMSENGGRVFFDSGIPLVGTDTNGKQDVYEWERDGEGSCEESVDSSGGCIYLLSGGTSNTASWLIGADANGENVFLVTRAQLTPEAQGGRYNLFDARIGGVQPLTPLACSGTGCQGIPAAPPTFATPASTTFTGVGNFPPPTAETKVPTKPKAKPLTRAQRLAKALKVCGNDRKRSTRARCKRTARKRYGSVKKAKKKE
jgi:hypothetical protein